MSPNGCDGFNVCNVDSSFQTPPAEMKSAAGMSNDMNIVVPLSIYTYSQGQPTV